jgi:putative transcriptional regulator
MQDGLSGEEKMSLKCSNRELIARNVKKYRTAKKFSQNRLAKLSHTSQSVISGLEAASFNPSVDLLNQVARGLQVKLVNLFQEK